MSSSTRGTLRIDLTSRVPGTSMALAGQPSLTHRNIKTAKLISERLSNVEAVYSHSRLLATELNTGNT